MKKLVLVKLGGSLITDKTKPFTERPLTIKRLSGEIHQAREENDGFLIIGHGGGSYPHYPAYQFKTNHGVINKQSYQGIAEVQDAASRLNRLVVEALLKAGQKAISFNPSSFLVTKNRKIKKSFLTPVLKTLEFGMLPIVFGDVVLDLKIGCCILSTEVILNHLAKKLNGQFGVEKIIYAGTTDGVYDADGQIIPMIKQSQFNQLKRYLGCSDGIDVTGGMLHKVEEALKLTKLGVETLIINGNKAGNLNKAILGEKVTGTGIC